MRLQFIGTTYLQDFGELTYLVRAVLAVDHVCFCEGVHTCVGCLGPPSCFDVGCLIYAARCSALPFTSQHFTDTIVKNTVYTPILFSEGYFLGYFLTTMWVTMMRLCFLIHFNKLILIKKFDSLLNYLIQTCSIKLLEITHQHGPMIPRDSSQVIMTPEIIRWIWTRLNFNIQVKASQFPEYKISNKTPDLDREHNSILVSIFSKPHYVHNIYIIKVLSNARN